jgi:hypothetical protein
MDEGRLSARRAREKAAGRAEDTRRLAAGEVTADQLREENGLVKPGMTVKIVNFGRGPRRHVRY